MIVLKIENSLEMKQFGAHFWMKILYLFMLIFFSHFFLYIFVICSRHFDTAVNLKEGV